MKIQSETIEKFTEILKPELEIYYKVLVVKCQHLGVEYSMTFIEWSRAATENIVESILNGTVESKLDLKYLIVKIAADSYNEILINILYKGTEGR